jgi:hypothetical protein
MSKFLRPLLVGAIVGFAVAFLLTFLYGPHADEPKYYGAGAGLIAVYLMANLAGNRAGKAASAGQKTEVLETPPPAGRARLYLYREGFVAKLAGLNVSLDGRMVAQLKSPQFTCITLAPGPHTLSAAFGGLAGPQNRTAELSFNVPENGAAAVRMTMKMGVARNAIDLALRPDVEAVKIALAGMAMTEPEVAEI